MTQVLVAALPWNLADMMSVQVAGLKAFLGIQGVDVAGRHYYLDIGRYFTDDEVDAVHSRLLGEQLYAMLLFPECAARIGAQVRERSRGALDPERCRERLRAYTEEVVDDVASCKPALIGFTTTHMQYLPSIATARAIKERLPQARVVLGGLALHGDPARATLEIFPWIDYIIVGEGEIALWRLAQHVQGERTLEDVPQLLYRVDGEVRESAAVESVPALDALPLPDYSDYFHQLKRYPRPITPRATIEMVRGCRWGRCSFCVEGLPSRSGFRTKSPDRVAREIERCVADYHILDFVTSDPDVAFNAPIFAAVGRLELDVRFMVELSGLVQPQQFETMINAGVRTVQIGIESFSPALLKAFNKGVSLAKYVQLMRMCADRRVELVYNNIHHCPFETQQDLDDAVENMRRLVYFQPPRLSEFRVSVGSSIYANYRSYGIKRLAPSEEVSAYPQEVADRVGMLVSFNAGWGYERADGVPELDYGPYLQLLADWRQVWALRPRREARRGRGFIRVDHTVGEQRYSLKIDDPIELEIFEYCQHVRRRADLGRRFSRIPEAELDAAIERLWSKHLLFRASGECVALVSLREARNTRLVATDRGHLTLVQIGE